MRSRPPTRVSDGRGGGGLCRAGPGLLARESLETFRHPGRRRTIRREPDKAVFVDCIFHPSGHEDAKQRLVVGGRRVGAKERVSRIADGATPTAQHVNNPHALPRLQRPAGTSMLAFWLRLTCGIPGDQTQQRVVPWCHGEHDLQFTEEVMTNRLEPGGHPRVVRSARVVAEFIGHETIPEVGAFLLGRIVLGGLRAPGSRGVIDVEDALLVQPTHEPPKRGFGVLLLKFAEGDHVMSRARPGCGPGHWDRQSPQRWRPLRLPRRSARPAEAALMFGEYLGGDRTVEHRLDRLPTRADDQSRVAVRRSAQYGHP